MDRLLECATPRSFACRENRISVFLYDWRLDGREVLFEAISRDSVLSSISLSLFNVIHVFTEILVHLSPGSDPTFPVERRL